MPEPEAKSNLPLTEPKQKPDRKRLGEALSRSQSPKEQSRVENGLERYKSEIGD